MNQYHSRARGATILRARGATRRQHVTSPEKRECVQTPANLAGATGLGIIPQNCVEQVKMGTKKTLPLPIVWEALV